MQVFKVTFFFLISLYTLAFVLLQTTFGHSTTQIVEMTKTGFTPSEATIDINGSILFVNKDNQIHWPASNTHPTHEIYPEFDPKKPVEVGQSWIFKPTKIGSWKYHDHLLPHFRGTIIVTEEKVTPQKSKNIDTFSYLKEFFSKISGAIGLVQAFLDTNKSRGPNLSNFDELKAEEQFKALEGLAGSDGAEKAWGFVKDHFKGQGGSTGNIHDLAHLAGGLLFKDQGLKGLKLCSTDFSFGCFHGFLDQAFQKSLDDLEKAEDACKSLGNEGPFASCVHGIGHGVASFYQTLELKKSLTACQRLKDGAQFCFDGVFMEFERAAPDSTYSKEDPYQPCSSLEQEFGPVYSYACGRNQPNVLMGRFGFTFEDLIKVCLGAPNEFKTACVDTLGFTVARGAVTSESITLGCQKIGIDEFIARCSKAAAGELIFQNAPGWQEISPQVCESLAVDYKTECQAHLDNLRSEYNK